MDREKNNPRIAPVGNNASVGDCSTGTTGYREKLSTVAIPNTGESQDAPSAGAIRADERTYSPKLSDS